MTLVVAHRGASVQRAREHHGLLRLAVAAGADAIELDVHLTSDGQLAVIHDETVDRTTDGTGEVASFTLADLRKLDAGARFTAADGSTPFAGKGVTIPTLQEVLDWLPDDVGLVVEIKARAAAPKVVEALRERAVRKDESRNCHQLRRGGHRGGRTRLDPELPTGYLLVPNAAVRAGAALGRGARPRRGPPVGGGPGAGSRAGRCPQAAAYGRQMGCYVVNDPDRMKQLAAYGLWGFVTDVPDVARAALGPAEAPDRRMSGRSAAHRIGFQGSKPRQSPRPGCQRLLGGLGVVDAEGERRSCSPSMPVGKIASMLTPASASLPRRIRQHARLVLERR